MRLLLIISICVLVVKIPVNAQQETCSAKDHQPCSTEGDTEDEINKYSEEHNTYAHLIHEAVATHQPCNATAAAGRSSCDCYTDVITADLMPFRAGISRDMLNAVAGRGTRYQIVAHKLYRQPDCMFPARCAGIEHFVRANLAHLPDLEAVINCRDWPQINRHWGVGGPVFSFSKTAEYADIMYPAWSFWEGGPAISLYPTGLGRWDRHRDAIGGEAGQQRRHPWEEKQAVAFFRGSRTSSERDSLVLLSRDQPDLADAQYTKNQAWKSAADTLGAEPAAEVSLEDHCAFKYLFNFRGVAASFRFKHLFLCGSLVFHVGDEWLEFFYPALRPWVHYVPVRADPSAAELRGIIEFFRANDDLARQIAQRGFEHVWQHLDLKTVECYWRRLLRRYAKLQRFEVVRDESLIEVR